MKIIAILEYLANNVHHKCILKENLDILPLNFQMAFITNNSNLLKEGLADVSSLANRDKVVKIIRA